MSENIKSEALSQSEKPVQDNDDIIHFPSFPDATDKDFEEDVGEEERNHYKNRFPDLNEIRKEKLHCTACDRHLGCSARNESRMRSHPMLRTLMCHTCHTFYNSGEFEKGDDGSELYCRWCGQGGQVYCCSDCPHVFCAKCIRRNFGNSKIKEIENTDDWKCFKCNPNCLWDHRAVCWALLRFCDLRNKIAHKTEDSTLKEKYLKACATDESECCKNKINRKKEKEIKKKGEKETDVAKKQSANIVSKISPSIQVKKFASINPEEVSLKERKAQKRSLSPNTKQKIIVRPPQPQIYKMAPIPIPMPPMNKRTKFHNPVPIQTVRFQQKSNPIQYTRIRPKPPLPQIMNFNGLHNPGIMGNFPTNDNINLSLESLTQGLDMAAVAGISNSLNDDVVCTPDFPLEPLCEVNEDVNDDDVQCITPTPSNPVFHNTPAPPQHRISNPINPHELSSDNIIQMTENDVTVNEVTGGLKFRVDPQTLSSNKMYRLPDGRIFAINANPNMPGGYSATIVALTDNSKPKTTERYAAKLNPIPSSQSPSRSAKRHTSSPRIVSRSRDRNREQKRNQQQRQSAPEAKAAETPPRNCDVNVPVEWFRYNLIDAVDSLEYSLQRLHRLKKEATTMYLRSRTVNEMKTLQKRLDSLLSTSSTRFKEIRENLDRELKSYITKKMSSGSNISDDDDDDDVEILNDVNDDPIFIDENSSESTNVNESNCNMTQNNEVDLTGPASSELNESGDKSAYDGFEKDSSLHNESTKMDEDITINDDNTTKEDNLKEAEEPEEILGDVEKQTENQEKSKTVNGDEESLNHNQFDNEEEQLSNDKSSKPTTNENANKDNDNEESSNVNKLEDESTDKNNGEEENSNISQSDHESGNKNNIDKDKKSEKDSGGKDTDDEMDEQGDNKSQDVDMSAELIETLLSDDTALDGMETRITMDTSDEL